jgi:hypothetical protein
VELESQREAFHRRGLGLAAVSYDPVAVLADFATRRGIGFPLLSDTDSAVIRRFGLLNPEYPEGNIAHGVPFPGTFITDEKGIVRSRFFEEKYVNRRTAGSALVLAGDTPSSGRDVETPAFRLRLSASNTVVVPGERITLVLDLEFGRGLHAYAPGAGRYRALDLRLVEQPRLEFGPTVLPPSRPFEFEPLRESVPVFEGRVRMLRDLVFAGGRDWGDALDHGPAQVVLRGSLDYQVCSESRCFPPATLPVQWSFEVRPLDRERPPEPLRRK